MMNKLLLLAVFVVFVYSQGMEDIFELDGNAFSNGGVDWNNLYDGTVIPQSFSGIKMDPAPDSTYTQGGSKDIYDISSWKHTDSTVPDKNELLDAFASAFVIGDNVFIFFGADRFSNDGDSSMGFWFFQDNIQLNLDGTFNGLHKNGDLLVIANFGSSEEVFVYEWSSGSPTLLFSDAQSKCGSGSTLVCAITNEQVQPSPWAFSSKSGNLNEFPTQTFMEGGLNLTAFFEGRDLPCFSSFLAVSRSSSSLSSQLKDFVLNEFKLCGLDTFAECTGGVVDETKTTVIYDFYVEAENIGFGNLYNLNLSLTTETKTFEELGITVPTFKTQNVLAPQTTMSLSGSFSTVDQFIEELGSHVEGFVVDNSFSFNDIIENSFEPVQCPTVVLTPACNVQVTCDAIAIDQVNEHYVYDYSTNIENTGFGYVTVTDATVEHNGNTFSVTDYIGELIAPTVVTTVPFSGQINSVDVVSTLQFSANLADFRGNTLSDSDSSNSCPSIPVNPSLNVTKSCSVVLEELNDKVVVKVLVFGRICNNGNIKLKSIQLADDLGTVSNNDDIMFQHNELYSNECVNYEHGYYPNVASYSYSDTVTVTGQAILNLGQASISTSATCDLCP